MITKETISEALGKNIKELRKLNNHTQADMAEHVGLISSAMMGSIERGDRLGTIETIVRIAATYEVSIDWLVGLSKESNSTLKIGRDRGRLSYLMCIKTDGTQHCLKWDGIRYIKQIPQIAQGKISIHDSVVDIDAPDITDITVITKEDYIKDFENRAKVALDTLHEHLKDRFYEDLILG